jgi:hypothetical protein
MNKPSGVLRGEHTLNLGLEAMTNRIINLQFTRKNPEGDTTTFTIRSDYEIVYRKDQSYYYVPCTQKPGIKVSYNQVSDNIAISVRIEVSNLFFWGEEDSMFNVGKNPVTDIKLQMGYLGQFPDFVHNPGLTLDDYYNLTGGVSGPIGSSYQFVQELNCMVLDTYLDRLPPDSVTVFECCLGTALEKGLRYEPSSDFPCNSSSPKTIAPIWKSFCLYLLPHGFSKAV